MCQSRHLSYPSRLSQPTNHRLASLRIGSVLKQGTYSPLGLSCSALPVARTHVLAAVGNRDVAGTRTQHSRAMRGIMHETGRRASCVGWVACCLLVCLALPASV